MESIHLNSYCFFTEQNYFNKSTPVADPIKLHFFANEVFFRFFAVKLSHFIITDFFP